MNENVKKLRRISRKVDLSCFYVISVYKDKISLQGDFNPEISKLLHKYKRCKVGVDSTGYIVFKISNIEITLT